MLHIGYYIIGKERKEHEGGTYARECGNNKDHRIDATMNFCPECGNKLISVIRDDSRTLDIYDIPVEEGSVEDHFLFPEYAPMFAGQVIGVSNYDSCGHFEPSNNEIMDLDDLGIIKAQQYENFMNRHSCDIKLLRKYVYDDLEIKYGMFEYDY